MKRVLFTLLMVLVFATNVFALGDIEYNEYGGDGGDATVLNAPVTTAMAGAQATALANQQQGQVQGQGQFIVFNPTLKADVKLMNDVKSFSGSASKSEIIYNEAKELYEAPAIQMQNIPILLNGKIGEYKLPYKVAGLKKLTENDTVTKILGVYDGSIFWRIRLEDVEVELFANATNHKGDNVRYLINFKDSVTSASIGAGGGGSFSMDNGLIGGAATGSTGYSQSTANPQFIITFYEVQ